MTHINIAFLNCFHFYHPDQSVGLGPQSVGEFDEKKRMLARLLLELNGGVAPDMIGLAEVGAHQTADILGKSVRSNTYETLYVPAGIGCDYPQGLAVLYNPDKFQFVRLEHSLSGTINQRPYWVGALFQCQEGRKGAFWLVINHWKSNFGGYFHQNEAKRSEIAESLGDFCRRVATESDAIILAGDFNCEPWERPFHSPRSNFKAVRERSLVTRPYNKIFYAYNLMWRWLGEPDDLETSLQDGYVANRPRGTFRFDRKERDMDWRVWDHFLVSRATLRRDDLIRAMEATLRGVYPDNGVSDHAAIALTLGV
jgi:exonuclease III